MIENIVSPKALDNDVAVIKILQLMGQLTVNDISYLLKIISQIHAVTSSLEKDDDLES